MYILRKQYFYYNIVMTVLAFAVVALLGIEMFMSITANQYKVLRTVDIIIYSIFCLDYFIRFFINKNKLKFFKKNIIDLIAILPFNALLKVIKSLKGFKVLKTFKIYEFLKISKVTIKCTKLEQKLEKIYKR